jgi:hypothetical protein
MVRAIDENRVRRLSRKGDGSIDLERAIRAENRGAAGCVRDPGVREADEVPGSDQRLARADRVVFTAGE